MIRQHFKAYGKVESVESVHTKNEDATDTNATDVHEACVTFASAVDALNAYAPGSSDSKVIKMRPVESSRKSGVVGNAHAETTSANPYCGCDEEDVSFSDALKGFCDCGKLKVTVTLRQCLNLKNLFENFRPLKKRINHYEIVFDTEPKDSQANCLSDAEYVKRAIQVLCTCVGERFNELTLRDAESISLELLDSMAPMLQRLETLSLHVETNASVLYALPKFCPNLADMDLVSMSWDGECSGTDIQQWPSLQVLHIGQIEIDSDTESGEKFHRFIELNPQLDLLHLDTIVDIGTFSVISDSLPNLSLFSFVRKSYDDIELILDQLAEMKQLASVKVNVLTVEKNEITKLATCAERFRQMKQMKLATLFQNYEPDTDPKEEFTRVFTCAVKQHDGCHCHGNERVLEIIDLEDVETEECTTVKLPKDRPVFVACINTKNDEDTADAQLLLKVYLGCESTKQFYPNVINRYLVRDEDHILIYYISYA